MNKQFDLYKENNEWKANPSNIEIEQYWEAVVKKDPEYVVKKLKESNLDSRNISFAIECLSANYNSEECLELIIKFLKHDDAIVREGAVLALLNFDEDSGKYYFEAVNLLHEMEHADSSSGVRQRIEDFFERFRFDHDWD